MVQFGLWNKGANGAERNDFLKKKWKSAHELEKTVSEFLKSAAENEKPITRLALTAYLGLTKEELSEYERGAHDTGKNKFSRVLKTAEIEIERYAEELLLTRDKASNALMFYLEQNFGWGTENGADSEMNINIKVV